MTTEQNIGTYNWIVRAYHSSSPTGGFVEADNSPILANNDACAEQFMYNGKVYVYYCQFVGPTVPMDWDIRLQIQANPGFSLKPDAGSIYQTDTSSTLYPTIEGPLSTHTTNFVAEYKTKNVWTAGSQLVQYLGVSSSVHFGACLGRAGGGGAYWYYFVDGTGWTQLSASLVQSQWYNIKRIFNFAEDKEWVYINGVYQGYYAWRELGGEVNSISYVWFALGEAETGTMWLDSFRTRQYVSPEPIHGSWGSEENHICTIESCNLPGVEKNTFSLTDTVYANGSGYSPSQFYYIYVVQYGALVDTQVFPTPITPRTNVQADEQGKIPVTSVWSPSPQLTLGNYDIVVDVNGDGKYNAGVDAIDTLDINGAGFFVVPEYAIGTILALAVCFGGVAAYRKSKRNKRKAI